jgi:hypothetical protein
MYQQLEEVLQVHGLNVSLATLKKDLMVWNNVEGLIYNLAEEAITEITVDDIDSALDIEIPTLQLYFQALQQLRALGLERDTVPEVSNESEAVNLLEDYGRWMGIRVTQNNILVDAAPMDYIREFTEAAWIPSREEVENFLLNFYNMWKVQDFCDTIGWDDEDTEDPVLFPKYTCKGCGEFGNDEMAFVVVDLCRECAEAADTAKQGVMPEE